ncbi:uncharacterized protein AMSG_04064 [Thecamonas trahens ATCC 50062]|uniref:Uncharacterized protein n=1 Tax=Thecamonas trahens ATCC 50062 TaxID=461836 RepID=A0A0L0D6K9_THETB|nr:hypothetical protein AMSG_04064 [Thecamonas trahens ATCC 50062]KNC47835.1 hypothetical protein AMSG_04064 [Thecamonas trahens ATCC 50062]|eukprot:XP_013759313.1 hypothetical protein AMSG_04064 [Thecamonas trahens ATCC 50062]
MDESAESAVRKVFDSKPWQYVLDAASAVIRGGVARTYGLHSATVAEFVAELPDEVWGDMTRQVAEQTLLHIRQVCVGVDVDDLTEVCPWLALRPPARLDVLALIGPCGAIVDAASAVAAGLWHGAMSSAAAAPLLVADTPSTAEDGSVCQPFNVVPDGGDDDSRLACGLALYSLTLTLYAGYMMSVLLHYSSPGYAPVPAELIKLYGAAGDARDGLAPEAAAQLAALEADLV